MFGCGEASFPNELGFPNAAAVAAFAQRADRLRHTDWLERDAIDRAHEARLRGVAFLGSGSGSGAVRSRETARGRVHTIPSTLETVRLGVFDTTLDNLVEIDSGDEVVYPDTWSHFLNRLQPGVAIQDLAQLRRENPGRGPHSIIGPVAVRGAQPGDLLAIHFLSLRPVDWGATFVNPAELGVGTLPEAFPIGRARYLTLDTENMRAEFRPGIELPLAPFQGTFAVAPEQGGVVNSVPPGQYGGNIDLRDLTEGSTLYLPVWREGGKLYTGDSHATQGDGEVNNQALESAMREVRVRVDLHPRTDRTPQWPFAETAQHWIAMGMDADLNEAFRIATRNTIAFLERAAGLDALDAYSLASIALSFRVTQFVNLSRGVHAMIPKALFSAERRQTMAVV